MNLTIFLKSGKRRYHQRHTMYLFTLFLSSKKYLLYCKTGTVL